MVAVVGSIVFIILFLHIGIVITITPVHTLFIIFLFGVGETAISMSLFPLHTIPEYVHGLSMARQG